MIRAPADSAKATYEIFRGIQLIVLGVFMLSLAVTSVGWATCTDTARCENPDYPIGPTNKGNDLNQLTCCRKGNTTSICSTDMVTFGQFTCNTWKWTYYGIIFGTINISIVIWLIYCCNLHLNKRTLTAQEMQRL
ncbi:MAG: hypothetical protein Hyperionvirus2_209 [Hyperionvirus sp.]|uniref:Uncharacterized protein n=1 Tax=Hyperionvirus sp. TaxID=2487770 RepID=A0A3G5A9H8_9VIRU|nr:MAG: hypothetical protein Hyperionvirus2_209 [Hyperionvirus sp.]